MLRPRVLSVRDIHIIRYTHYNYQCSSESQQVRTVRSNDVDGSNVVEDDHVPPKIASIIKT